MQWSRDPRGNPPRSASAGATSPGLAWPFLSVLSPCMTLSSWAAVRHPLAFVAFASLGSPLTQFLSLASTRPSFRSSLYPFPFSCSIRRMQIKSIMYPRGSSARRNGDTKNIGQERKKKEKKILILLPLSKVRKTPFCMEDTAPSPPPLALRNSSCAPRNQWISERFAKFYDVNFKGLKHRMPKSEAPEKSPDPATGGIVFPPWKKKYMRIMYADACSLYWESSEWNI